MKLFRFPLFDEATETPAGGGAGVETAKTADSAPAVPDDSDLVKSFEALNSKNGGDAQSATVPEVKGSEGHPGTNDGKAVESSSSAFDDDQLSRARQFGLSDEVINSHGSPEELERTLFLLTPRFTGEEPEQNAQQQAQQPPAQQPAQPQQPQGQQPPSEGNPFDSFSKKFRETGDTDLAELCETVSKSLSAQEAKVNERIAHLERLEQEMTQERSAQASRAFDQVIDSTLADVFGDVYGVTSKAPLTPKQWQDRAALAQRVIALTGAKTDREAAAALHDKAIVKSAAISLNHEAYEKHLTKRLSERSQRNGSRRLIPNSPPSKVPSANTASGKEADLIREFDQMLASQ